MKGYKFLAVILTAILVLPADAKKKTGPEEQKTVPQFTVIKSNPITSVKDQNRSGTCWCFSALSFIESEILRTKDIEDLDLSEMFVVSRAYHDRAIKYVRLDGHLNFAAGSSFGDVLHVIQDYGIVPQHAMPGLNYGTELPEHFEMDAGLKGYVSAIAKNPNKKLTTAWVRGVDGILDAYLGEIPEWFDVDGIEYTPQSYRNYLGIDINDYVSLTSFTHHPFYSQFVIEVCDNWRWDTSYNLPLDELMEVMDYAIEQGYTIAWGGDVSEKGFTRTGTAIIPAEKQVETSGSDQEKWVGKDEKKKEEQPAPVLGEEIKEVTQEMRQDAYDRKTTTDDHGMHVYGIAEDATGRKFYMTKNSWGESGDYEGIWYMSETFVKYKTMNIVVNKNAIPEHIRTKLGL